MSSQQHAYQIDLQSLKDNEEQTYDFRIGESFFAERENTEVLGCDVEVEVRVRRHHESYELEMSFDGDLSAPCDRCLDPVKIEIGTDYDVRLKYGEEYDDTSDDEVITIPYGMTRFDVSPLIYDTLLLSIPLRCVHPEGECNEEMAAALRAHRSGESESEEE